MWAIEFERPRGAGRQSRPCDKRRLIGCARKVALFVWEYRGAQEFRVRLPQGRRKLPRNPPSLQAGTYRSASLIYGISLISPVHCVRSRYAPKAARREAQHVASPRSPGSSTTSSACSSPVERSTKQPSASVSPRSNQPRSTAALIKSPSHGSSSPTSNPHAQTRKSFLCSRFESDSRQRKS
jgi:hypothetical protein